MHGAVVVAIGGAPGAGEIFHAVNQVGIGIAQPFGVAGVAEAARGRELDLHQADGAAASDQFRMVLAFAHDHPMHQRFRHQIGRRPDWRGAIFRKVAIFPAVTIFRFAVVLPRPAALAPAATRRPSAPAGSAAIVRRMAAAPIAAPARASAEPLARPAAPLSPVAPSRPRPRPRSARISAARPRRFRQAQAGFRRDISTGASRGTGTRSSSTLNGFDCCNERALVWPNPGFVGGLFPNPDAGFTKNYALPCFDRPENQEIRPRR